jgi:hypothetical protein
MYAWDEWKEEICSSSLTSEIVCLFGGHMKNRRKKRKKNKTTLSMHLKSSKSSTVRPGKSLFPAEPTRVFSNDPLYGQPNAKQWWGFS